MSPACCNAPLCTRRAIGTSRFCSWHRASPQKAPEGTRVVFDPTPASLALYSRPPRPGASGTVTAVALPGGKRTFLPGPGGGLLYVRWDETLEFVGSNIMGVSPRDCCLETR